MNINFLENISNDYLRRVAIIIVGIFAIIAALGVVIIELIRDLFVGIYEYLKEYWPKVQEVFSVWSRELKEYW